MCRAPQWWQNFMLAMHSPCSSEQHPPSKAVVAAAAISRRSSENGSLAKREQSSRWCSPVWIPFRVVTLILACAATELFPSHTNMFVAQATDLAETGVDVAALDRRANSALRLLEASDPAAGEAELRGIAERYPSYAQAPFYLGLLSQSRSDPETAISFYAATLRADETHADAMNNIGAVLSALPPLDRARVAKTFGVLRQAPEALKMLAQAGSRGSNDVNIEAVDSAVEGLYRKTLQAESTHRWALNNLGLHLHWRSRNEEAVEVFHRALKLHPRDAEIHYNMGVTLQTLGLAQEAAQSFTTVLRVDPQHVGASINLAALYHRYGDTSKALELYRGAAEVVDPGDSDMIVMLRNNVGGALFQLGEHTLAKVEHQAVLSILKARREEFPRLQDDEKECDVYLETLVNLHRARKASCDWRDWERHLSNLVTQVDFRQLKAGRPPSLLPFDTLLLPYPVGPAWRRRIAEACSAKYTDASTAVAGSNHSIYEHDGGHSAHQQGTDASTDHGASVVQDDRGEPTKERLRRPDTETRGQRQQGLIIGFIGHDFAEHPTAHMMEGVFVWQKRLAETTCGKQGSEGALETGRGDRSRKSRANDVTDSRASTNCCTYAIYSYGGGRGDDDQSESDGEKSTFSRTRQSLRSHASSFVDLYATGHAESAARIQADGVDILVDLQGHTLGGRSEIMAARPARLQVSYLVFPGTSGAPYVDYLLADRHVTPPEHAAHYSESLIYLPRTYQANLYEGLGPETVEPVLLPGEENYERAVLRRAHGLPGDLSRPVFANFNKIDKLDPESFKLWMQVLRRVPGSVLWLLEANAVDTEEEAIRKRLGEEAQSRGIDGRRIVWARRLPKREHLLRHAAADLFLDTLIYGAHSTATDALAGGLPFLTLAGGAFSSRVGVSLLRNAGPKQGALLVAGQREYEDLAVELVSTLAGRELLRELRASLTNRRRTRRPNHSRVEEEGRPVGASEGAMADADEILPLFDTEAITRDLNRAFMLMSDVDDLWRDSGSRAQARGGTRLPHIVLTGKKLTDAGRGRLSGRGKP